MVFFFFEEKKRIQRKEKKRIQRTEHQPLLSQTQNLPKTKEKSNLKK